MKLASRLLLVLFGLWLAACHPLKTPAMQMSNSRRQADELVDALRCQFTVELEYLQNLPYDEKVPKLPGFKGKWMRIEDAHNTFIDAWLRADRAITIASYVDQAGGDSSYDQARAMEAVKEMQAAFDYFHSLALKALEHVDIRCAKKAAAVLARTAGHWTPSERPRPPVAR